MEDIELLVCLVEREPGRAPTHVAGAGVPPHLQGHFGHTLDDAPAHWRHAGTDTVYCPLGDVLGQVGAALQLRKEHEEADEAAELSGVGHEALNLGPDGGAQLRSELVYRAVGGHDLARVGRLSGEQRVGRTSERLGDEGEQARDFSVERGGAHKLVRRLVVDMSHFVPFVHCLYLPGLIALSRRASRSPRELPRFQLKLTFRTPRGQGTFTGARHSGTVSTIAQPVRADLVQALDDAPLSRFHRKAVVVSGVGFFTDAYDLFVISTVAALVSARWHLSTIETSWVSGSAILGAFVGAIVFGRLADVVGRKKVYAIVAAVMVAGAVAGALAPNFVFLVVARFVLGLGVGGDYPVSAVMMSEYSNRNDRGRLVGLVFSMQALGLIVGPLVALGLLESNAGSQLTWRLLLGLGAVPAGAVLYLRTRIPESPRYKAAMRGDAGKAAEEIAHFSRGVVSPVVVPLRPRPVAAEAPRRPSIVAMLKDRRLLRLLVGTAGCWFVFDYAYYGNTLSLPVILKGVDPGAHIAAKLAWSLAMFVVFALPGYAMAVWKMDRIGHRRLQVVGFAVLTATFALLAAVPALTTSIGAFLAVFGLSYFFVEFGPNTTTFVLPSEVFPVSSRTTGHGIAAGLGKLGAFVGVFVVPTLQAQLGLRAMIAIAAGSAALGMLLSYLIPEPARRGLEEVSFDEDMRRALAADANSSTVVPADFAAHTLRAHAIEAGSAAAL